MRSTFYEIRREDNHEVLATVEGEEGGSVVFNAALRRAAELAEANRGVRLEVTEQKVWASVYRGVDTS